MVSLVKGYLSKVKGVVDPPYEANVLDFLLALSANGDEKAFKFVSGNLSGFLLCHMQRLNQKQRIDPFIKIYQHEILTRLDEHIARIRHIRNEEGNRDAFTAGIDDKVIVNSYQV